jgi:pimeloyl-ACP methyl ester carboxylesterase
MNLYERLNSWWHERFLKPYRLHFEDNKNDGQTVIFLHGIAASSESWRKIIPILEHKYRVITIDLLGFGKSPKPEKFHYTLEEHVASIHHTIKRLRIKKPYILAGHSLGSLLAAHYTSIYPNEVSRLYMVSPPIYVSGEALPKIHIRLRMGAYARAYKYLRNHRNFTLSGAKHLKKILKSDGFNLNEQTWLPFERSLEQCIENQNVLYDLQNIKTPTKIYYGTQDPLIIPGNIHALNNLNYIEVTKVNAGHLVNLHYAKQIAKTF